MRIDIITIFPDYFRPLDLSLVGKARAGGLLDVRVHDLRDHTDDPHRTVDDAPYGGGPGMVMRPEPWWRALEAVTGGPAGAPRAARVVVPTPSGVPFTQPRAADLADRAWLVLCCGRYEGVDRRVLDAWADDELSLGDYVLAGGEVAAMAIVEVVTRLVPGVLGNEASAGDDSFSTGLLEGPTYTRPPEFAGRAVPEVLLSGNHAAVARWRREQALLLTARRRPDLLARVLPAEDAHVLRAAGLAVPGEPARGMAQ